MENHKEKNREPSMDDTFIRVLSHQLKAPINAIRSLLNTISDGFTGESNQKTIHFIERASVRAIEAEDMISDLLDYQLYSQEPSALDKEFGLTAMLNSLLNKYNSIASEKDVFLHSDIPPKQAIYVFGDERSLFQATRNIIENAVKYTATGGDIKVSLRITEKKQTCMIEITDDGQGIAADELPHIFEPFYRSIKHKTNIAGTGLGLSIAKQVVDHHRGTLTVESKENAGTTFRLLCPIPG